MFIQIAYAFSQQVKKDNKPIRSILLFQLLRYQSQTQYKTLTGGLISLSIIAVIVVGFTTMISQTLQRTSITSSITTFKKLDPPLINLQPGQDNMYMVGIAIQSIDVVFTVDLFNGPQYFDLEMYFLRLDYGVPTYIPLVLEQCTRQHWNGFPQFTKNFDDFQVGKWACLPLNESYPIQGMYSSPVNTQLQIKAFKCRNSTQNNNSCASQQQIDALFNTYRNFYLSYNYINSVINPNSKQYISYYIEGNDYSIFSNDIAAQAWVYYTDYQISSDSSIWPFAQVKKQTGFIVEQKATIRPYGAYNDSALATLYLAKSVNSLKYQRQVQKISAVFSYIGGLVGAVTAALFFVNIYTDSSLEISIGLNLFQEKQLQESNHANNFNFLGFIRLSLYRFLKLLGCRVLWQIPQKLQMYQQEAVKQLDVQLLLKRLIKLQACMAYLFTQEQIHLIKEEKPITIEHAKRMRSLLLKHQRLKQDKSSKVMNADNYVEKNIQFDPYIESAASIFNKNTIAQQRLNTFKIHDLESVEENKIQTISSNSLKPFNKISQIKDRTDLKAMNNLQKTQK